MHQMETDVVVIGGGAAGLAAAVAAAESGAGVTVFEKASTTGGTGNMGMGLFAVESRLQREKMISLTREEVFNIFMDYTHWRVDARLVKAYIDKSAGTIDWLENMGVEFFEPTAYFPGSHFTQHIIKGATGVPESQASAIMMRAMTERAKELGVQIHLQAPAKKIFKEDGRVAGVVAENDSGEDITVKAKAVIVATGGFGDNPEWIKKYTGFEYGRDLFSIRIPGLVGEGIRMAWEAGAAASTMSMELISSLPPPFNGRGGTKLELAVFRQPNLLVNLHGERFMNEAVMANTTFTGNAIARQKNGCAFTVFDEATKKYYEEAGLDFPYAFSPVRQVGSIEANIEQARKEGCQCVFVADSLEELASQTGIDWRGLKETIDEYNRACDTGRDEIFNKSYRYLRAVKQPKFYSGKFVASAYGSLGGIKINYKMEVLSKDLGVIPGLYAAGTDACDIYGDSYVFVLPGNTMGFAVNSGRMAGENAAKFVLRY